MATGEVVFKDLGARLSWPLTPALIFSIEPPDFKKAAVWSAMLCEDSTAAGCFFLPAVVLGLVAIVGALLVYS